jgi:DNA-directed RNA polymerase subunit F
VKGKQEKVPEDEQYVFPNHHAPIISIEDFEQAQQIKKKRGEESYKGSAKYPYIFSSFVYCGDCGFAATGKNLGKRPHIKRGYECTQYTKYGLKCCAAHNMPEEKLLFFFKEFLKDVRQEYADYLERLDFARKRESMRDTPDDLQKELYEVNEELKLLLNQKLKDILKETRPEFRTILENSYDSLEQEKKKRIIELNSRINELQKVDNEVTENSLKTAIQIFDNIIQSERPHRKDLEMILDKILLYGKSRNNRIEFKLLLDIESLTFEK